MAAERILEKPGKKVILLGDEAIARGALEGGVGVAASYPGTPASEIGDSFAEVAEKADIYFEYSTNEKVALECAAGAAFSGVRSIVCFKHFGFNVAADSAFPLAYYGVKGGMVIVSADDPGNWSSGQSEQDTRLFARVGHMPMLEPADSAECKKFTKKAFTLSEKLQMPVILRITTRVAHGSGMVELGPFKKRKQEGRFTAKRKWNTMVPHILEVHRQLHPKLKAIEKMKIMKELNRVENHWVKGDLGIIANGISFFHTLEALDELGVCMPILKLGLTYPFPDEITARFIKHFRRVFVVEELEPVMENEIKRLAQERKLSLEIHGKDLLPYHGEYRTENIVSALGKLVGKEKKYFDSHLEEMDALLVKRSPVLCPGCPHRASFWAVKKVAPKGTVFGGDVGCYVLGINQPMEEQDWLISMGASEGIIHGIMKVSKQKGIAFIGDSTFFHAGIPGLINIIYNQSKPLVMVLDNRTTAMTGHQPHPGTGKTAMGKETKKVDSEAIARACGVENVAVVNPFNLAETTAKVKEFLAKDKPAVIICRQECRLAFMRRARKTGMKVPVFQIDRKKCTKCGICLYNYGCPAIHQNKGEYYIDPEQCWGCGVCPQVCPSHAISAQIETGEKK